MSVSKRQESLPEIIRAVSLMRELAGEELANNRIDNSDKINSIVDNNFGATARSLNESDIKIALAVGVLGDNEALTVKSAEIIAQAGKDAVSTAQEIVKGLGNLKKLEKAGVDMMNTSKNQEIVISAGSKAIQTSLDLWEKKKLEIQKVVRKSEHSSLAANSASRWAARAQVNDKLERISTSLHHPEKHMVRKPTSPSRGG